MPLRPYFSRLPAFAKLAKGGSFLLSSKMIYEGRIPHFLLSCQGDFQAHFGAKIGLKKV